MTTIQKPTHDYIATDKNCGCVLGVVADVPGEEKWTSRHVQEMIAAGCVVERVARASEKFRQAMAHFGHHCQPKQPSLL